MSTQLKIYEEYDLFHRPLVVVNAQGIPTAHDSITDPAHQQQVRIATQGGLRELHGILIAVHGPLHHAQVPGMGELTVLEIRIQSAVLFTDPDQIMSELLPEEFIGFRTGSPMEVVQYPGEDPK